MARSPRTAERSSRRATPKSRSERPFGKLESSLACRKLNRHADLLFQIVLADSSRLFRRSRWIRNPVKLNDRPAMKLVLLQSGKDSREIDTSATQLNKLKRISRLGRIGRNITHILQVHKKQPVIILI